MLNVRLLVTFFGIQLSQISLNFKTSCCNVNIKDLGAKACVAVPFFYFERNYGGLKSKIPCMKKKNKQNR